MDEFRTQTLSPSPPRTHTDIARVQPPILECRTCRVHVLPVALHDRVALYKDLARYPHPNFCAAPFAWRVSRKRICDMSRIPRDSPLAVDSFSSSPRFAGYVPKRKVARYSHGSLVTFASMTMNVPCPFSSAMRTLTAMCGVPTDCICRVTRRRGGQSVTRVSMCLCACVYHKGVTSLSALRSKASYTRGPLAQKAL